MGQHPDEMKGRIKVAAGELTGNRRLKTEGQIDKASGKVKKAVSRIAEGAKRTNR